MSLTEYEFTCKQCKNAVLKNDKYCKTCGADLSGIVDENQNEKDESPLSLANDIKIEPLEKSAHEFFHFRFIFIVYLLLLAIIKHYFFDIKYQYVEDMIPVDPKWIGNTIVDYIPSIIGGAVAFGLIPIIIATVRKIMKKKPTKRIYLIYFIISTVMFLLALSAYVNRLSHEKNNSFNNGSNIQHQDDRNTIYRFSSSEYSTIFQSPPKIIESSVPIEGTIYKGKTAELVILEDKSFCRAEYFYLSKYFTNNVNREFVYNYLNKYSNYTGLSYPTFAYEENSLGKVGSIRAYKTLVDGYGNNRKITYFSKAYYGNSSVMILYVGCPSELYPTPSISKFLNSISRS